METNIVYNEPCGTGLDRLPDGCVRTCVTSPPYFGLRDYGHEDQIGLEESPEEYVQNIVDVFRKVRRVLADDGTLWLNIGESWNGYPGNVTKGGHLSGKNQKARHTKPSGYGLAAKNLKPKDLIGIPWMVAFALRADGWYLRQDIIWEKPNAMPESVKDRCTKSHEYIFLLSKSQRYYYDWEAIAEDKAESTKNDLRDNGNGKRRDREYPGAPSNGGTNLGWNTGKRNKRSVWTVPTKPYKGAHFATFPPSLILPCILAGSAPGDVVLDPFMGSGTVASVALNYFRKYIGFEISPEYMKLYERRVSTLKNSLFNV